MKQKLEKLFLLPFLIGTLLVSCIADFDENSKNFEGQINPEKKILVKKLDYDAIIQNKKINEKIKNIRTNKRDISNFNSKVIYSSEYDFFINTDYAIYIEENEKHSYTFQIKRDSINNPFLIENLILTLNDSLGYDVYIAQYDINSTELDQIKSGIAVNLTQKTILKKIKDNALLGNIFSKAYYDEYNGCVISSTYIAGTLCSGKLHHSFGELGCDPNDATPEQFIYTWGACGNSGGGGSGGSSSTGGGDYHQGGGGSNSNNNTINTLPLINPTEMDATTPCEKLKNLFNTPNPDIKATIQNHLQTDIPTNLNGEKAAYLQKLPDGTLGTTLSLPTVVNSVKIRTGPNFYSAIHTHPNDTYPMFSFNDVLKLNDLNNDTGAHNIGMASFLLICQDDAGIFQTYAIVFDPNSINETINQFVTNPENTGCTQVEIADKLNSILKEEYIKDNNYERVFLKLMGHSNVSLYKANSTLTNWSKLSVNPFNNVSSKPCN